MTVVIPTVARVIDIDLDTLETNVFKNVPYETHEQFYSTDIGMAFLRFTGTGDYTGCTARLSLINFNDGSKVQRIFEMDTTTTFVYPMLETELVHAGRWIGQLTVIKGGTNVSDNPFRFKINGPIMSTALISFDNINTFTSQLTTIYDGLNTFLDVVILDESGRTDAEGLRVVADGLRVTAEELRVIADAARETKEGIRESTFVTNEGARQVTFESSEGTRQSTFDANEIRRDGIVNSLVTAETIAQKVAEKYQLIEAESANRLLSLESELADSESYIKGEKSYPMLAEHPLVNNPVLTGTSVTDRVAQGVADPFICYENGMYHMFFEIISILGGEEIGHAYSYDGIEWTYTQVVLTETDQHFAYPFVMKHNEKWYMIPDKGNSVDVYEATNFPYVWTEVKTLLAGGVDTTPFLFDGVWYMHSKIGVVVNLYVCDGDWLTGNWSLHPSSPILSAATDRGAGRAYVHDDCVILPMQGFISAYGDYAKWYKLSNLTPTSIDVTEGPMFINGQSNNRWNARGMHHTDHIDSQSKKQIIVADGIRGAVSNDWSIGVYTESLDVKVMAKVYSPSNQAISTPSTWTQINMGSSSGYRLYDTMYLWNVANKRFTIPQNGYYKIKAKVTEYSIAVYRQLRLRIYDKTNAKDLCVDAISVPAGGTTNHQTTLTSEAIVYLDKGVQISAEFYSTVATYILAGEQYGYFEIEKI